MQTATHRLYDRTTIPIVEGHLEPADVNEHSPPGSLATFWQQRQELTASLSETNEATNHWRAIATNPTCTWESFRTYVCHPPPEGNAIDLPIELLASLYDTQHTITSLKGPLQYKYEGRRRECYMASWSNTVVCKHHLPMITKAYQHKGTAISTIGPQNIRRSPHLSFLTQPSGGEPSPLPELIEVEWEDLPHPTDLLTAQPEYSTLLAAAKSHTGPSPLLSPPPPGPTNTHLPEHMRQGIPSSSPCLNLAWEVTRRVMSMVNFDLKTSNPDLDLGVTKRYTLQEGLRNPDSIAILVGSEGMTYCNAPNGSYIGKASNKVVDTLRQQYIHTATASPHIHIENATNFERDVASLLQRYDPDRKPRRKESNPAYQPHTLTWALSPSMWKALRTCMGITNEMFSSPLDRSSHSETYWSAYKEDELFGANHDAYSRPWTGACQAHVGESPEENDKAIRHAIGSITALPDETTCIIMFIPCKNPEAPHLRHLSDPNVRLLTTLEAGNECEGFKAPGHWLKANSDATANVHPTMHVIAVATKTGAAAHLSPSHMSAFAQATGLHLVHKDPSPTPNTVNKPVRVPKSITRMLSKDNTSLPPIMKSSIGTSEPMHVHLPCTYPLSGAPVRGSVVAYTDGSCKKHPDGSQTIGAAVHFPATPDTEPISVTINPNGKGPTLTINRAELSGIHQALIHEASELADTLHIYTDSLCSLSLIQRIINTPWTLRDSKHLFLLNDILNTLKKRSENGRRTCFHKVKSHIGIHGNEKADKKANEAAMDPQSANITEESNSAPYEGKVWVKHAPPQNPKDTDEPIAPRYLSNLSEDIKRKVTPHHSGGQFTSTGLFAQLWHNSVDSLLPSSISSIWSDPKITWYQATLALKARWGQLYTNRLAHRYGRVKNDTCPACKSEPDSIGHLLGGCKEATCKAMTIQRHNEGVRICHKTITRSSTFGGCYCIMDACPSNNLPPGVDSTRIPTWILPASHPYLQDVISLRPDLLIIEGLASNETRGRSDDEIRRILSLRRHSVRIHILEIGYCSDLRHTERDEEKQKQHHRLVQILTGQSVEPHPPVTPPQDTNAPQGEAPRPEPCHLQTSFPVGNVLYHPPVTLGRTGTLPASFIDTLKNKLKVSPKAANECATKLTQHAVHYVEKFYKNRFASLAKHAAPSAAPPRQTVDG